MSSSSLTTKENILEHQRHRKTVWWFGFGFFFEGGGVHWIWVFFVFFYCASSERVTE